jgi:thymidylate kinase
MDIISAPTSKSLPRAINEDGLVADSQQAPVELEQRIHLLRLNEPNSLFLDQIASNSRVLIVEGISGSGKDTFQTYLKPRLRDRVVYDYSEGEVLHSWKQLQIEGIFELRIHFMKLFVNYMRATLSRDKNAIFLLNRFHLSTYVFSIVQQPALEPEYQEIINALRTLPVHIFMLQLDKNEIERKSWHPERSAAWRKFQQEIVQREGYRGRLERYSLQQRLMLEAAKKQQIPYSVIKLSLERGDGQVRISKAPSSAPRVVRMNAEDRRISERKRHFPPTF